MGNPRCKNGNARRKIRARLKARRDPCAICGRPIDYSLPAGHPYSFEVDEKVPVSRGGSPIDWRNVQAAHRICNQRKGNKILVARFDPDGSIDHEEIEIKNLPITNSKDW